LLLHGNTIARTFLLKAMVNDLPKKGKLTFKGDKEHKYVYILSPVNASQYLIFLNLVDGL
jgi:hypothetical protein